LRKNWKRFILQKLVLNQKRRLITHEPLHQQKEKRDVGGVQGGEGGKGGVSAWESVHRTLEL